MFSAIPQFTPLPSASPSPPIIIFQTNPDTVSFFCDALSRSDLQSLMVCFSQGNPNNTPRVGITNYGPQFVGYNAVQRLFRQLFSSFQRLKLTEQGPVDPQDPTGNWLFSADGSQIGIQMSFSGLQVGSWFAAGTPYYSPPLSNIVPDSTRAMDLDASVIFSFDSACRIAQLAIYFDRYLMSQQLATALKA